MRHYTHRHEHGPSTRPIGSYKEFYGASLVCGPVYETDLLHTKSLFLFKSKNGFLVKQSQVFV